MCSHLEVRCCQFLEGEWNARIILVDVSALGWPEVTQNTGVELIDLPIDIIAYPEESIADGGEHATRSRDTAYFAEEGVKLEPVDCLGDQYKVCAGGFEGHVF